MKKASDIDQADSSSVAPDRRPRFIVIARLNLENENDGARNPDEWSFFLPAKLIAKVCHGPPIGGMPGDAVRSREAFLARVHSRYSWSDWQQRSFPIYEFEWIAQLLIGATPRSYHTLRAEK